MSAPGNLYEHHGRSQSINYSSAMRFRREIADGVECLVDTETGRVFSGGELVRVVADGPIVGVSVGHIIIDDPCGEP